MYCEKPWLMSIVTSRTNAGPEGLAGGASGAPGRLTVNGKPVNSANKLLMRPQDRVLMETPGGGGYGAF